MLPLAVLLACVTPSHTPTYPVGYPNLRGVMNHLPDGRWQFVLELPNFDRHRTYQVESGEPLDIKVEADAPRSRATWIVDARRVDKGHPFFLKVWADGDDFPVEVRFPRNGKNYGTEGALSLVILATLPRR